MKSLENRINRLEDMNPDEGYQIERVIYDSKEQKRHPERFKKVLTREDDTRKIFELQRI